VRVASSALLLLALASGCAHVSGSPAEESPPITVAVISFGGTDGAATPAENGCVMAVLEAGFRAVERRKIVAALPNENEVDFHQLGGLLGADMIVDGSLARGSGGAPTRLEPRLISTHSAAILATTKTAGRVKLTDAVGKKLCTDLLRQLP
jgi:hypothetical protein